MMSINQIAQAMERNRRSYDARVDRIRLDQPGTGDLRDRLADAWLSAMQRHYQLLWDYLQLRDEAIYQQRLSMEQLRAPVRPDELPEALSRYVTTTRQPGH
jgi:hypothetical protein